MITVRTSPAYVNRVRQDWTANGGVYGDGGVYALVPSNDPFAQFGPTLDLTFAGNPTDLLTASTTAGYTLNTYFTPETYQIAVQYAVWGANGLEQKNFSDIVTFTRASTGTYFNSAGTLTTAAINEARFDYNPSTLAAQGLLIEESRTNSIRNSTMQGASAPSTLPTNWNTSYSTTLDGLTRGNSAAATVNGIASINVSLAGTATSTSNGRLVTMEPSGIGPIAALPGQTWTLSVYLTLVTGTMSGIQEFNIRLDFYDSAGTALTPALSSDVKSTITSTTSRPQFTATTPASTAFIRPSIQVSYANGAVIDFTIRIGLPQLEQGAFATSVIPTTTTALTRSADVASVNTLSPWFNSVEGTIYFEGGIPSDYSTGFPTFYSLNDATANNNIQPAVNASANVINVEMKVSGSAVAGFFPSYVSGTTKLAFAYKLNDVNYAKDGVAGVTDTSAAVPTVSQLNLGSNQTPFNFLNGYLRRITYYPRRLANADLQAITA